MKTELHFVETVITPTSDARHLQVTARLRHTSDTAQEELHMSLRLPAGDRSILELQRELIARAALLLEAAGDEFPQGKPSKPDVWDRLAR